MNRPIRMLAAIACLAISLPRLQADETPPEVAASTRVPLEIESLARLASDARDEADYADYRDAFLQHPQARLIRNIGVSADDSIRFCVLIDTWQPWLAEPEIASRRWEFSPRDNGRMCNPYPQINDELRDVLGPAGNAGARIARERLPFRRNCPLQAITRLLKTEASPRSIDVLIEAMLDRNTVHSEFTDTDEYVLAQRLARFDNSTDAPRSALVMQFARHRYRPAARPLGAILAAFKKDHASMRDDDLHYDAYVQTVGGEYAYYFERISGRSLRRKYDKSIEERIDRAKKWWRSHEKEFPDARRPHTSLTEQTRETMRTNQQ